MNGLHLSEGVHGSITSASMNKFFTNLPDCRWNALDGVCKERMIDLRALSVHEIIE